MHKYHEAPIAPEINDAREGGNKLELTDQEKACQEFIESNKMSVSEVLVKLIKDKQFILVGESYLAECEPIRHEIAMVLSTLQGEGLTHIALEGYTEKQAVVDSLDYTYPQVKQILKEKKIDGGWGEGNYEILITAKLLGLKVVLIDFMHDVVIDVGDGAVRVGDTGYLPTNNQRNTRMMEILESQIDERSKVLVFIGNDHVHKKEVRRMFEIEKPLGAHLVEKYDNENVSSVRHVGEDIYFDYLPDFFSKTTTPKRISAGKKEVVVLPDIRPIKPDERFVAADYVIAVI